MYNCQVIRCLLAWIPSLHFYSKIVISASLPNTVIVNILCFYPYSFMAATIGIKFDHFAGMVLPMLFQLLPNSAKVNC